MNPTSSEIRKNRIIRRLVNHSSVYFKEELELKSIDELQKLQDLALIKLILRKEFQKRKNKSINQTY